MDAELRQRLPITSNMQTNTRNCDLMSPMVERYALLVIARNIPKRAKTNGWIRFMNRV